MSGFAPTARHALPLNHTTHWVRYAPQAEAFVVGDAQAAWLVPGDGSAPRAVERGAHPLSLPVHEALLADLLQSGWNDFRFPALERLIQASPHEHVAGDLLRHLVFLPDYGQLVEHPAAGALLALRSGRVRRIDGDTTWRVAADVRTRGKGALTFAAHPLEPLLFYGDNAGDFAQLALTADGFGTTTTMAKLGRKASACLVRENGTHVLLGGLGYLQQVRIDGKKPQLAGACAVTVRSLHTLTATDVLVNAGMQGLARVTCADASLIVAGAADVGEPLHQLALAADRRTLACIHQGSGTVTVGTLL